MRLRPKSNPNLIEKARTYLLDTSHEIRIGKVEPRLTKRMAACAFFLANSDAPTFEKAQTIAEVRANLSAAGADSSLLSHLSEQLINEAYPTTDPYLNRLNPIQTAVLREAMKNRNPHRSFSAAYDDSLHDRGRGHESVIVHTEIKANPTVSAEAATQRTGAHHNPFIDDE